ncbi:hypothetical protein Tco_0083357, partial [Tanacetum coccineum]
MRPIHTPFKSLGRWTKDHPIANVIGDPSLSVSTRKQLHTDAMCALSEENASTWETANEGLTGTSELNIINDSDSEEVDEYITMHEKTDPGSYR